MTFIQHLVPAIPKGGQNGEQISDERGFGLCALVRIPGGDCLLTTTTGSDLLRHRRIAVHDGHDADGRDEHGEELAGLPTELENPHGDDVREERVGVPDRGDIAQSVNEPSKSAAACRGREIVNGMSLRSQRYADEPEHGGEVIAQRQPND